MCVLSFLATIKLPSSSILTQRDTLPRVKVDSFAPHLRLSELMLSVNGNPHRRPEYTESELASGSRYAISLLIISLIWNRSLREKYKKRMIVHGI